MTSVQEAIIIGGGPCGLAAALRLQQSTRMKCEVYELRPGPTTLGGAIGILSNGLRLLDRLGVYEELRTRGSSCSKFVAHSTQGGLLGTQEDGVSYARSQTGYGYMRIKRTDLIEVMLNAARKAKIPVHFDKRLTAIRDDDSGVTATFSDGSTATADILLGCDGIHSQVRQLYVDPNFAPEYTGISGIFSIIPTSELPPVTAKQLSGFDVTMTEDGMFAAMHCTDTADEVYWGFSQEYPAPESDNARDGWEVRRKGEVEGFKANLHKILDGVRGDWGSALKQLVDGTEIVKFYPVYRLPFGGSWYKGRCILLGDAAHAMPPHAGQGVSMAVEDVFMLARLLADPTRPATTAYEKFVQIRRPRVDGIHQIAARNGNARKKTGPWGLWMKESMIRMSLWVPWFLGIEKLGLGKQHLVYDIDAEKI